MRTLGLVVCVLVWSGTAGLCASYDDLNDGIDAYNAGRWDSAIAEFDKALAANDLVPSLQYVAHLDRADARAHTRDLANAYADLTACLALRPGDEATLDRLRLLHLAQGQLDQALQEADAAIARAPGDEQTYLDRARIHEWQGDGEKELQDFQTALAKNPANVRTDFLIGIADFQLGHYDDAATAIAKALPVRDPATKYITGGVDGSIGWVWLDMIAIKQGKPAPELPALESRYTWPYPIVDFFQGHSSEQQLLDTAKKDGAAQLCTADFYVGEWHKLHGDAAGAKTLFQGVASKCEGINVEEWNEAEAELKDAS